MKPLPRIGIFLLALAISLFLATLLRAQSSTSKGFTANLQPNQWFEITRRPQFLSPQNIKISFSTQNGKPMSLYILTPEAFQEWNKTGTLNTIISIENHSVTISTYDIPSRGFYTLLAYNPNPTAESISITLTLYGFEKDLLITTTALAIAGLALIITPTLKKLYKPQPPQA